MRRRALLASSAATAVLPLTAGCIGGLNPASGSESNGIPVGEIPADEVDDPSPEHVQEVLDFEPDADITQAKRLRIGPDREKTFRYFHVFTVYSEVERPGLEFSIRTNDGDPVETVTVDLGPDAYLYVRFTEPTDYLIDNPLDGRPSYIEVDASSIDCNQSFQRVFLTEDGQIETDGLTTLVGCE